MTISGDTAEAYDGTYANCNDWGERRWATPGVIVNGEVVTTKLQNLNIGIEEFVEGSMMRHHSSPNREPRASRSWPRARWRVTPTAVCEVDIMRAISLLV